MRISSCCMLLAVLIASTTQFASADDKMVFAARSTSKFVNLPSLPACTSASVQNGDPSKGGSVILAKATSGCVIPWHWHTPTEQVMLVSGSANVDMKDGSPTSLHAGDYISLPSKGVHQFTCTAACSLFIISDAAFDMHYVDAGGKEIPTDEAIKAKSKTPMKKASPKKDMKM
jgi:quercetin dioxygenase-like cupin family protein